MKDDNSHIEIFERALGNDLSAGERKKFEARLDTDASYKKDYDEFKALIEAVKNYGRQERQERIAQWEQNRKSSPMKREKVRHIYRRVAAAAAVALLVVAGIWWWNSGEPGPYNSYFTAYPDVLTIRGDQTAMATGLASYNAGDYQQAIKKFIKTLKQQNNEMVRFYLAESYLASAQFQEADSLYLALPPKMTTRDVAEFHRAIAMWELGEEEQAESLLREIAKNPRHAYSDKAKNWLQS